MSKLCGSKFESNRENFQFPIPFFLPPGCVGNRQGINSPGDRWRRRAEIAGQRALKIGRPSWIDHLFIEDISQSGRGRVADNQLGAGLYLLVTAGQGLSRD